MQETTGSRDGAHPLVELKAEILSQGVVPTSRFLQAYGEPYLVKKRAYGNADDLDFLGFDLPQEIVLDPGRIVAAATVRRSSGLRLDVGQEGEFIIRRSNTGELTPIGFPRTPAFYDRVTLTGKSVTSITTLYGGGSLGIFAYGHCALVDIKAACHYCSIAPNRNRQTAFKQAVSPQDVEEALDVALDDDSYQPGQIMLNGGNLTNVDQGFKYYIRLAEAARRAIDRSSHDTELHLIVYPPDNLSLIRRLQELDISVAMNTEVWDLDIYREVCPGKEIYGGRAHLLRGLEAAVDALGPGRVFSIFVGGLESLDSQAEGMSHVAAIGAIPVVNIFHADPETPLSTHPEPTVDHILTMGRELQELYQKHSFCRPFYAGVGRNAIDNEAYLGLFG